MREAVRGMWLRPWVAIIGALFGLMLVPIINAASAVVQAAYYRVHPIAIFSGEVLSIEGDTIKVHLRSTKRDVPNCSYLSTRARTQDVRGEIEGARMERIDLPEYHETLPAGVHDLGVWAVRPRSDGVAVLLSAIYDCSGYIVITEPLRIALP